MDRRRFLRAAGSLGIISSLAGCSSLDPDESDDESIPTEPLSRTETPKGLSGRFDDVVDLVEAGADSDGNERIDEALTTHAGDGTVLVLPAGRYKMGPTDLSGYQNLGLVGKSGTRPTIVPAEPVDESREWLIRMTEGGDYLVGGFDLDFRKEGYGGSLVIFASKGGFEVFDIHAYGIYPLNVSGISCNVDSSDDVGQIRRFITRDGTVPESSGSGIFVSTSHSGTLHIDDCEIWNRATNGVYASAMGYVGDFKNVTTADRGNGEVHVRSGVFKNNNIANIRIGSTNSTVKDVHIHNVANPTGDTMRRSETLLSRNGAKNSRGIWIKNRQNQLVENATVILDAGRSGGAIEANSATGSHTIRNSTIEVNTEDANIVYLKGYSPPSENTGSASSGGFSFENVRITGTGGGLSTDTPVGVFVEDRSGTTFRDCLLQLSGAKQDGIHFIESDNCLVQNTRIDVPGEPIRSHKSKLRTTNVSFAPPQDDN
ncbi:right-handed parallel beta-helix repeat-containing protein [Salinigranum halophilum]|uniref:right-handed parallel beta-helix repeat-containing protein n=1 Tax=Salinigranum halophilum TaxID=2565931 RepID=UPI0010A8BF17|nr:right-handed parallel beta-helix repeat-containing protein [Salinigranum halophilum]